MGDKIRSAAPGWYPHPQMANTLRYWDGKAWTDQVAPAPVAAPPSRSGPGVFTIAVGVLLAVLLCAIVYTMATANDGLDCATENADRARDGQPLLDCGN